MKEQYFHVPVNIVNEHKLPIGVGMLLYCFIKSICDSGKTCAASNDYLAKLLGTSNGTVRYELSRLKHLGYISVTKNGSKRELKALPIGEKVLDTSNNSTACAVELATMRGRTRNDAEQDSQITDTILTNTSSSSNPAEPTTATTDSDSSLANEKGASRASLVRKIQQFQLKHNLIHSVKFCEGLLDKLKDEILLAHPDASDSVVSAYVDNYVEYRLADPKGYWVVKGANENYNLVDCYQRACEYTREDNNKAEAEEAAKKAAEEKAKEEEEYRKKIEEFAKKNRAENAKRTASVWLQHSAC